MFQELSIPALFPTRPKIYLKAEVPNCNCNGLPRVIKSYIRSVATLQIGEFDALITQCCCNICRQPYENSELKKSVAQQCRFGFDVIVYVGKALFIRCKQDDEIQKELRQKNITISLREIAQLGKKFIVYLALAHQESQDKIKKNMQSRGGYILHLDGTCELDSPHLISSIDELSTTVLGNLKIPTENATEITQFLEDIKEKYGDPIALVHDMSNAIIHSVEKVFPNIPDYICHYHFLKDIGKDLFGLQYNNLRRYIKTYRVRSKLREILRSLKELINEDIEIKKTLQEYLTGKSSRIYLMPLASAYITIAWILEANCASNGFGFPFDRPHLDFYLRLKEAYPTLKELQQKINKTKFQLQLSLVNRFLQDEALKKTIQIIQQKTNLFDKLRFAMRIAMPNNKRGLNDEGDSGIKTIEEKVTVFRQSNKLRQLASKDIAYYKMIKQIDKYWKKLFADPINVTTPTGLITIQPQRTNNILEQFFRNLKRDCRKKSGTHSLSKVLKSMLTDTPLIKNLANPEYLKIILNGKNNLAERFAEIDVKQVREAMANEKQMAQKYPEGMAKIFKIPHLPKKLASNTLKMAAFG